MFTPAEQRAIDQLSTDGGRLGILAADQRTSLTAARTAAGLPATPADLTAFKLELARALGPHAPAMLLDPEVALPALLEQRAVPPHTGVLVSLERSGSRRAANGLRDAELLPGVGAAGVRRLGGTGAKLLVRLRGDREGPGDPNCRVIRRAAEDCAAHHLLLVVEVLVYPLDGEDDGTFQRSRPDLIREAALLAEDCGARYLKLEYPGSGSDCRTLTDALSVPWALLSAGVDHDTFVGQLQVALDAGASGFIAGRSIWKDAIALPPDEARRFLEGEARRRLDELLSVAA
jgi:tagatose 1,6-diphosphate aldolase